MILPKEILEKAYEIRDQYWSDVRSLGNEEAAIRMILEGIK